MEKGFKQDEFTMRDEIFFVTYRDVIRSPYPIIMQRIQQSKTLQKALDAVVHLPFLDYTNPASLETFAFQRQQFLLFDYLKKDEDLDVRRLEDELLFRYTDIYEKSNLLAIGESLKMALTEDFVKQIYIYSETYDPRIHADIQVTYEDMSRVSYVTGEDLGAVLDALPVKPTAFFINDIDYIIDLTKKPETLDYTHLFLADYRYNLVRSDDGLVDYRFELTDYLEDRIVRFSIFKPIAFTSEHLEEFGDVLEDDDGIEFKLVQP